MNVTGKPYVYGNTCYVFTLPRVGVTQADAVLSGMLGDARGAGL